MPVYITLKKCSTQYVAHFMWLTKALKIGEYATICSTLYVLPLKSSIFVFPIKSLDFMMDCRFGVFLQKLQEFLGISSSELVLHSNCALTQLELPQVTKIGTALCVYRTHSVSFSWKIAVAVAPLALAFDMKYELSTHSRDTVLFLKWKIFFPFLTDSLKNHYLKLGA